MLEKILYIGKWSAIVIALAFSFLIAVSEHHIHEESRMNQAYTRGSMNAIIYYRHHEPPASWLIVAAQQPGQIPDTDEAVDNLELKARVWESEHYVKEIK